MSVPERVERSALRGRHQTGTPEPRMEGKKGEADARKELMDLARVFSQILEDDVTDSLMGQ